MKNLTATTSFRVAAPAVPAVASSPASESVVRTGKPEHASCTPMPKPKDHHAIAGMTAQAKENFSDTMKEMQKNQEKAKARDVNIAKKTFWRKALGVLAATVALAVATAGAVASGGALVPVIIAAAGVAVIKMAVADAWFARASLRNAQAREKGETTMPYNIPLEGASATANLFCWMLTKAGVNADRAKKIAVYADAGLRLSMTVSMAAATLGASLGAEVVISNADRIIPVLTTAASLLQSIADMKVDEARTNEDEKTAKQIVEIQRQFDELQEANALREEEIAELQAKIDKAAAELPVKPVEEQPLVQAQTVQAQEVPQVEEQEPEFDLERELMLHAALGIGAFRPERFLPQALREDPHIQAALRMSRRIFDPILDAQNLRNLQQEYGHPRPV